MNRTDGKLSIPAQQHSERLTTSNSERARAGSRAVQMHVIVARDRAWTCFGPGTDHNADGLVSLDGTNQECYYVPQLSRSTFLICTPRAVAKGSLRARKPSDLSASEATLRGTH